MGGLGALVEPLSISIEGRVRPDAVAFSRLSRTAITRMGLEWRCWDGFAVLADARARTTDRAVREIGGDGPRWALTRTLRY